MKTKTSKPKMSKLSKLAWGFGIGTALLLGKGFIPQESEILDAKLLNVYDIRGSGATSNYQIGNDTISITGKPENAKEGKWYKVKKNIAPFTDYYTIQNN